MCEDKYSAQGCESFLSTTELALFQGEYNLSASSAIVWGRVHEPEAIQAYEVREGVTTAKTGLWLHPNGVLGGSPDGLIGSDGLLEVKCPWAWREYKVKDLFDKKEYCLDAHGTLKQSHHYYHQVQGCLACTGRKFCDFVVWTPGDLHVTRVQADASWTDENIPKLLNFYHTKMLPLVRGRLSL